MNKIFATPQEAIADVFDGATIMFGGFGGVGVPIQLIQALHEKGIRNLTLIANSCGGTTVRQDVACLFEGRQVKKAIVSFPVAASKAKVNAFEKQYLAGEVELELVPQGTLAERIRAGGAGIPAFYTPVGVGTIVEKGKEKRVLDGRECLLETALHADFAFLHAYKGDPLGNLVYRRAARNFNPIMATAARITIAEVEEIVEVGELDPEAIVTPGIYIQRLVKVERPKLKFE